MDHDTEQTPAPPATRTLSARVEQRGASTSRGMVRSHEVEIDRPEGKGGADRGPMGGELLLLALGGCFSSNLLAAAAARAAALSELRVDVEATLEGTPERMTAFALRVSARCDDRELLAKLTAIAERGCIVANTLRPGAPITVDLVDGPAG